MCIRDRRRLAKGHGAGRAAKAACWGHDNSVCSAGADGTLVLWDVTTGAGVRRVENAHADAATGVASRGDDGMVASCGYDGLAKLWDLRQGGARAARTWDHGTRCETIVAVPGGNLFATAGGRDVALWDGLDDAVLHRFRDAHAKSATCLAVDGARTRLLSGGLDGLVKVHSLADHCTVARCGRYAAPVNAIAVAGGDARKGAECHRHVFHVKWNAKGTRLLVVVRARGHGCPRGDANHALTVNPDGADVRVVATWLRDGNHPNWLEDGRLSMNYEVKVCAFDDVEGASCQVLSEPVSYTHLTLPTKA